MLPNHPSLPRMAPSIPPMKTYLAPAVSRNELEKCWFRRRERMTLPLGEVPRNRKDIDVCGTASLFLTEGEEQENAIPCKYWFFSI